MIELPDNAYDNIFDNEVKKGCIVSTKIRFPNGDERYKYCVTVSYSSGNNPLVFVLSTSQTDFYDKHPNFNQDVMRFSEKELSCFPKETIINCRELFPVEREKLKRNFQNGILKFIGYLPEHYVEKIDAIIAKSHLLSLKEKRRVLGDNFQQTGLDGPI